MSERVAVIAVHGVGHHNPREAARACADMLALTGDYDPFVEAPLRIRVEALPHFNGGSQASPVKDALRSVDARPAFVRRGANPAEPEIAYMKEQLSEYVPHDGDCVYETVALHSRTKANAKGPDAEVHVYDMYWTDLSRVSTAGLMMIGELYQLLFYVTGLGRHTLDFATDLYTGHAGWTWLARFQRWAEGALVLWVPVLNLCGAGLIIALLPRMLMDKGVPPIAIAAFFIAVLAMAAWALLRWRTPGEFWPVMFLGLGVAATVGAAIAVWLSPFIALIVGSWLFVGALIVALMYVYAKRRPGAAAVGIACVAATTLVLVICAVGESHNGARASYVVAGLKAGWWVYEALHLAWSFFFIMAVAVSFVGAVVADRFQESFAQRTIWTANLSVALPGLLVLILNLGLWQGGLNLGRKYIDWLAADGIGYFIEVGTPWVLGILMAIGIVALLCAVWGMLPSVVGEVLPRDVGSNRMAFGRSLSAEFEMLRFWGEVLRVGVIVIPFAYFIDSAGTQEWKRFSAQMTAYVGLAVVAILFGPFKALGMGLRTAIDVAIDVANWLRLHPKKENPRAKICARFVSLMQDILAYRDSSGNPFTRIVIFSHSQGTVISSELLRYLKTTKHELATQLEAIPLTLLTMGCPLHQLYSQRFPIQYAWARDELPWEQATPTGPQPEPAALNVRKWVNAYRSGDYVGRQLWEDSTAAPGPVVVSAPPVERVDYCIGPGGHTHYWDDSAMPVARVLDEAVRF